MEHQWTCGTVEEDKSIVTGWKQFIVTTNDEDCVEKFTMKRASWWNAEPL